MLQFNKWFTWLTAVGFIVTAGLWVMQLNKVGTEAWAVLHFGLNTAL